jgi:hypothetical protein
VEAGGSMAEEKKDEKKEDLNYKAIQQRSK